MYNKDKFIIEKFCENEQNDKTSYSWFVKNINIT